MTIRRYGSYEEELRPIPDAVALSGAPGPASVGPAAAVSRRSLHTPLVSQQRWARNTERDPWSFPGAALSFWHSARAALWQGVHAVGLAPGDRVLVPAYCCGVEAATLLGAGLRVDFYRIRDDLTPDLEHLAHLCREPAQALLLIHYFGLPQPVEPIAAFASEHGLILIEDCAHGLFGRAADGAALGSRGELAVFSLKKHLPVPNGGLLVLRHGDPNGVAPSTRPHLGPTARRLAYLAALELEHRWPGVSDGLRRLLRRHDPQHVRASHPDDGSAPIEGSDGADGHSFDPEHGTWGASRLTRVLYERADGETIRRRRAHRYRMLLEAAGDERGVRPLRAPLVDGASPWLFPLVAEAPEDLRRHLLADGVASIGFWRAGHPAIPRHLFPFEERLRRDVVALPVHHGLTCAEVARIGEAVQRYGARMERRHD